MNRDDVIRMARDSELIYWTHNRWWIDAGEPGDELERFAALVAAAVREECAKYLESSEDGVWANTCAYAIRAMGKK